MKMTTPVLVIVLSTAGTACVSQGKYDRAVATTETTRAELRKREADLRERDARLQDANADLFSRHQDIAALSTERAALRSEIAALEARVRSGEGDVAASRTRITALQQRLGELETAQRASEARAAIFRELTLRLKKQIDDGDLALVIRDGRMVLQLPNDVLFDTGRTELKPAGKDALKAVAGVIKQMPSRQFQVAGHTDDVPIHNDRFASNWELSAGRALRVVHFLIGEGADERALSAAGYSEIDPVATNTTPDGRKRNRRTEITLQPNIDELVKIP